MIGSYPLHQTIELSVTFTDQDGQPSAPTTVRCKVEKPDRTESVYTNTSDPPVISVDLGIYTVIVAGDQAGTWTHRWEGTSGPTVAVDEAIFYIEPSAFA